MPSTRPKASTRPSVSIGVQTMAFPQVPVSPVLDCLRRLPHRRDPDQVDRVAERLLWLPRLGVTVLAHEPVTGGWVCTLVGVDTPTDALPVGVFVVSDLEIATAIATACPWQAVAGLSGSEYADAWRVRLAAHGRSPMLGAALLACADLATLAVDTADPRVFSRSGCRSRCGFALACRWLCDAGLLAPVTDPDRLSDDPAPPTGGHLPLGRVLLTLPSSGWPQR